MKVVAVSISEKKGTKKRPVEYIKLIEDYGIDGDAHAGKWHRQVSLLAQESMERMKEKLPTLSAGDFAENILTEGLTLYTLPIGTVLKIGECLLEVTQIGKECHLGCEIRHIVGDCVMPREGIFTKVLKGGKIKSEDKIEILK
ncbi:MAG: MOSC domain-containing protein [Peptoniphilaceae bacterium]|uniref:MOSC domain-containing protein n=1 Tax=Parvimonas sp. TaxID=1944660 RepID=UPI0025F96589|nr:MOSC domain-containing protein [Parvimonas sp.]MCI5998079.1 MOSC domain-containing protein [Parvimonas sp.]MDD7764151.1 MOSC domain-containing protein [Peptoniphilaceae bacterium]MDY3050734.1 MOSC domain-containing protein [Parvimonas sp.]